MRAALLAAALLVAACDDDSVLYPQPGTASTPTLHREGRWMVDDIGRTVLMHGVNAVWKIAPYYAPEEAAGFTAADADFLAANGFNVVRLGVLFVGVMPQPDVIDQAYLASVDRVVQLLASRRIWIQLDFHQDMYNEEFQGEGFPDWAVHDDGLPNDANKGFPGNEFASLALNRVYDNFWQNTDSLWDRYRAAWVAVAQKWKDQPYLLGYDMFNEPWPGQLWPLCFRMACPGFDATLQDFQEHVLQGIRSVDSKHFVFFEPQQLFSFGAPNTFTAVADPALGFSWHSYCSSTLFAPFGLPAGPDCTLLGIEAETFGYAEQASSTLGAVSMVTEFGAGDDLDDIGRIVALADQHLIGWTYWAYKAWNDPTGNPAGEGLFADDDDLSTLKIKADLLVRPYPQAIAGVPTELAFNETTKAFTLVYAPNASAAPTEIFVPARHYPNGYVVTVTGGNAVDVPGRSVVQVTNNPGAAEVRVEMHPI